MAKKHASPTYPFARISMALAVAAMTLSACGGGDSGGSSPVDSNAATATNGSPAPTGVMVDGQSQSISGNYSTVRVLMPPVSWNGGSLPTGSLSLSAASQPASALKELTPGAYIAIPYGASSTIDSLTMGVVTDLAGNGDVAIGRWTNGTDSSGNTYTANQGQVWAIGAPVTVDATPTLSMQCSLAFATRPTSANGNTAPGKLDGATATLTTGTDVFNNPEIDYTLNLQYSIGSDTNQSFSGDSSVGSMTMKTATKSTLLSTFMGPDATHPYLVVSYGIPATTTGNVNGLAVLRCG